VRNQVVLDLACGDGFYTRLISDEDAKFVLGVDVSSGMVALAHQTSKSHLYVPMM
jgi:ubiquinone/menaquinone biosynthesis C-methylase UbiE